MTVALDVKHLRPRLSVGISDLPGISKLAHRVGEACAKGLSKIRDAPWQITLDCITQTEILSSEAERALLRFESKCGSLTSLLLFDRETVSGLLETAMGGTGAEPAFEMHERPLSKIEKGIVRLAEASIAEDLVIALNDTLGRAFRLFDRGEAPEMDKGTHFVQSRYIANIFTYSGELSLTFLQSELESQLIQDDIEENRELASRERVKLQEEMGRSEVKLVITLGTETLTVDDIATLRPGNVLRLKSKASSPVIIWCSDVAAYEAILGRNGERLAVTVISAIS